MDKVAYTMEVARELRRAVNHKAINEFGFSIDEIKFDGQTFTDIYDCHDYRKAPERIATLNLGRYDLDSIARADFAEGKSFEETRDHLVKYFNDWFVMKMKVKVKEAV